MAILRNFAGGILFAVSLYFTAFFGCIVFLHPLLPLVVTKTKLGRKLVDFFIGLWFAFSVAFFEILMGVKIKIQGQPSQKTEGVLILMNHRTRLDWLFLMAYQLRCGSLQHYKISLKQQLKFIPGPGWAMQFASFLFLKRSWEIDQPIIAAALKYFRSVDYHPHFLLFPEGTDFTANTLSKSDKYAEKYGLPKYRYCLHPRTTGFAYLVQQMREEKLVDSLLNISVAYPKTMPIGEFDVLKGNFPEEIHFHVHSMPISGLPTDTEELATWCKTRWEVKERQLEQFYEKKEFSPFENQVDKFLYNPVNSYSPENVAQYLYAVLIFWSVFSILVIYALCSVSLFRWYTFICVILAFIIERKYGGIDHLQFLHSTKR